VTSLVHELAPSVPVERAATLEDIRAEILTPQRLNAFVLSGFAGVALLIAVVGVSGVLAFSVSARVHEFGVRLAIGSTPGYLMSSVLLDGVRIVGIGIVAGTVGGYIFKSVAASYLGAINLPSVPILAGAAALLVAAGITASMMPALRASRVDVLKALRAD
jgi:ABC-type antimicrobial peptide transport system permease subunit